jgi:hypothetical protein
MMVPSPRVSADNARRLGLAGKMRIELSPSDPPFMQWHRGRVLVN